MDELASKAYSKVLYAKACTDAGGDDRKAAGTYLYMRINELRQEHARARGHQHRPAEYHPKAICPYCGNRGHEQVERMPTKSNLRCTNCRTFYFVCN